LEGILSNISGMQGHVRFMKLITINHHHVHTTLLTFSRSWVERSRSQTTLSEAALSRRRRSDRRFAVKDHLVCIFYIICCFYYY